MLNDSAPSDARKVITGKDGQLFVNIAGSSPIFLAEADSFTAQTSFTNTDYQPMGSDFVFAVPTGHSIAITLSETVIRDDVILNTLIEQMQAGYVPYFDFQGKLRRYDGQYERQLFRNCVPDGSVDLMNISPGEIIKRAWNFRANANPELLAKFKS